MGNICETMGITRKDPALGNQTVVGNSSSPAANSRNNTGEVDNTGDIALSPKDCVQTDEIQSPVPAAAAKRKASEEPGFSAVNTTEIKLAFAKKQSDEAAAAAAVEVLTGPRLRLLPHKHTLFCERKVTCSADCKFFCALLNSAGLCSLHTHLFCYNLIPFFLATGMPGCRSAAGNGGSEGKTGSNSCFTNKVYALIVIFIDC